MKNVRIRWAIFLVLVALTACGAKPPSPTPSAASGTETAQATSASAQEVPTPVEVAPSPPLTEPAGDPAPQAGPPSAPPPAEAAKPEPTPVAEGPKPSATPSAGEPGHAAKPAGNARPVGSTPDASQRNPAVVRAERVAAERRAWESARPVLDKHCAKCHTQGARGATKKKLAHFDMTSYPVKGEHADTVHEVLEVLGLTGKKPTMPSGKPGAVGGAELEAIKAWAAAWYAAERAGAHAAGAASAPHAR